jgi:polygalacturonase
LNSIKIWISELRTTIKFDDVSILRYLPFILLILYSPVSIPSIAEQTKTEVQSVGLDTPFTMPEIPLPQIPGNRYLITDFGAVGDGHTSNTVPFAKAIETCSRNGGGRIVVPAGIWLTGPIMLENNIDLHLEERAVLKFSTKFEDYPVIETSWEGLPLKRCTSPISGRDLEDISISGQGIIDGSGDAWRPVLKNEMAEIRWEELLRSGGVVRENNGRQVWWPSEEASLGDSLVAALDKKQNAALIDYAAAREYLRPSLISLINCQRVLLDGPTFQNSAAWNIHPLLCENVIIRNISVRNPWYSTNGDGLDIESCRNVRVYNCTFDVGDDALCLKSGRNEYGRKRGIAAENIVISDCIVYHGHGGFVIGSEMSGGVRNVSVQNCVFLGTDLGLRFKSTRGRGGVVENIYIKNILMEDILTDAIRINLFYQGKEPSLDDRAMAVSAADIPPVTEETPQFRQIFFSDITCRGANRALFLQGLPEMPVKNIELDRVFISAKTGIVCMDAENIRMKNITVLADGGPVLTLWNSQNVKIKKTAFSDAQATFLKLIGTKSKDISLIGYDADKMKAHIELDENVSEDALVIH